MAVRKHVRAHVGLDVHTKQPHTEALCAAESTLHVRTYSSSGDSLRLKGVLLRNIRLESPSTMARSELYAKPWQTLLCVYYVILRSVQNYVFPQ